MKIIIDRSHEERQTPITTIDTKNCHYPYALRDAIILALSLDGHSPDMIDEVFYRQKADVKKGPAEFGETREFNTSLAT